MADETVVSMDELASAWNQAEKLLDKGKTSGALDVLRAADPSGSHATTLRMAGQAVFMQAQKSNSVSDYRKAAGLLRDAVKKNPRDKKANALYNQIRNEMQDKAISETLIPRLINDGTPTPAGLFAVVVALLLLLAAVQFASGSEEYEDGEALMTISWTDADGNPHEETVTIALHRAEAPLHVENFILLAQAGQFDGVIFHRIIDNFMIQSGDFEKNNGQGGYTAKWYGYCNGQTVNQDGVEYTADTCPLSDWSLPGEHTNGLKHGHGSLAAAHAGLNTDGSQFYIVPEDSVPSHLDWNEGKDCSSSSCHTVYGTVTDGLEHITAISEVPTAQGDSPVNPVTIESVEITDEGIAGDPWYKFW